MWRAVAREPLAPSRPNLGSYAARLTRYLLATLFTVSQMPEPLLRTPQV